MAVLQIAATVVAGAVFPAGRAEAQPCITPMVRLNPVAPAFAFRFGYAVAVSRNGDTALVGSLAENRAYVFVRSDGLWEQQGPMLVPTGAVGYSSFGRSVSLSADGNTAVVGAPSDNNNTGAAYIFVRSDGEWTQAGPTLVPDGVWPGANAGFGVALSADGRTVILGAQGANFGRGAAYVFARSGDGWSQQEPKLVPIGAVGQSRFGVSVALSGDGDTAIIGASGDNSSVGAAFTFVRSEGFWAQQGPKLVALDGEGHANLGADVSLSADGGTALVGAPSDSGGLGAAHVFVRSEGAWTQQGPKLVRVDGNGAGWLGTGVSLSAAGDDAMVGADRDNHSFGSAYLFRRSGTAWVQAAPRIDGPGDGVFYFGTSVALSGDGGTVVVGSGDGDNTIFGAAFTFALDPTIVVTQQPAEVDVTAGGSATFTVEAASTAPLTYQWRRAGADLTDGPTGTGSVISGAASPVLTITNAGTPDNDAVFDCVVSSACASATSASATLAVFCPADFNRDGVSDSEDFRDFLAALFSGAPSADFNHDGQTNSQDFFDFLAAFFGECA